MPKTDEDFDLLTDVECFMRRGHSSPWGRSWHVHAEQADDFEAYLHIVEIPYRRQMERYDCGCGKGPPHRTVAFYRVCPECDPVAYAMFD